MIAEPRLEEPENLARVRGSRTAEMVAAARAGHFARGERPLVTEDPFAIHWTNAFSRRASTGMPLPVSAGWE